MKVICITVKDNVIDKVAKLGEIPWTKISDFDKEEYERMIRLFGTEVAYKISRSDWKEE